MRTKKRGLATLLIIMSITFTIQGAWFESNPLGLKIKEIDDGEKDQFPYTLQVVQSDNKTISSLFYNNELIKIIGESLSKDEKTVTVTTYNEDMVSLEVVSVFQKGLPQSITTKSGSNMSSTLFRYERGQLVEKKEIVNGIMKHLITYWRNSDGSLALSREIRIDKENLVSFYTYESDQVILTEQLDQEVVKNTIHPSLIVTREYSVEGKTIETQQTTTDIEGNLTIEEIIDGSKIPSLYHSNGTLLR
ncbi:MAG: hypothetical protein EOM67_06615, partial [Spirochaetia bacterium]|nr:hypothetical protein [Spirochaetia bacterium]